MIEAEWPNFLLDIKNYSPSSGEYFIVSEISSNDHCEHILNTALITKTQLMKLKPSEIGYMVTGSGPHPSPHIKEYAPIFWMHSPEDINLEPLILNWESTNKTILWPDQGFLMTYGLFPRLIESREEIIWDEPSEPKSDVIIVKPISDFNWGNASLAQVKIKKDFIQDYSTLRKMVIIQLFYEEKRVKIDDEIKKMMGNLKVVEAGFENHSIRIVEDSRDNKLVLVEVYGFRILAIPGHSPITKGRWDYGELNWPGFDKPITDDMAMTLTLLDLVYVSDSVLAKYEGHEEYDIAPETGGVSYGSQWSVSHCHRAGRNTIVLELKKLYEGNHPEVVKHWHKHAVESSTVERGKKNIAEYAKELVDEYLKLGGILAEVFSMVLTETVTVKDVINLDKHKIDYSGWCSIKEIERMTWHIPTDLNKDTFLERCKRLNTLIVEGLNESILRKTLLRLGVDSKRIKMYKSLKLLELLIETCIISNKSGLSLINDFQTINQRIDYANLNELLNKLYGLYNLRLQSAHYLGKEGVKIFNDAISCFGISSSTTQLNYVEAIEIVYQGITDTLKHINTIIRNTFV